MHPYSDVLSFFVLFLIIWATVMSVYRESAAKPFLTGFVILFTVIILAVLVNLAMFASLTWLP